MTDTNKQQQEAPATAPRDMAGLKASRIVHFVMKNGKHRPLIVVEPGSGDRVNGILLFDGTNDTANFPEGAGVTQPENLRDCVAWATSIAFDDGGAPGTWRWPSRESVIAAAVDPAALSIQLEPLVGSMLDARFASLRSEVLQTVNEKMKAQAEHIEDTLNKYDENIQQIIKEGLPVVFPHGLTPAPDVTAGPGTEGSAAPAGNGVVTGVDAPAAVEAKHPHPGKCAVDGCGREYSDNIHHQKDRAKYHEFADPPKAEAVSAADAAQS